MKNNRFNKFLGVLTHNLGLKLLAAIVSCALWFIVNNITDPIDEIPFYNIPVEIVNADSVVNEGKIYEVLDGTDTVNVQVKGKTSVLNGITRDDIRAVADLSQITFLNTVQIEVSSKRNNSDLDFKSNIQNMKLAIEDVKRIQLIINPSTVGSPADGYVVGNVSSSQNIVRLQGPESLIQSINRVEAVANIDGYSSDINTSVELKLYDNEGTEIKSDSITMNISTVNVAVTILAVKEVPINVTFADTPAEGYISSGKVVCVPENVMLAGRRSVLDSISALNISDPSLTLKDKDKDVTTIINIKKYLPSGIQFADQLFSGNISVTAGIEPITTKKLEIPVRNFAAGNKPDDMDVTIKEFEPEAVKNYTIEISGTAADVEAISANDIIGVIDMDKLLKQYDMTQWAEGSYVGEITFNLPDTVKLKEPYSLTLVVSQKKQETDEN